MIFNVLFRSLFHPEPDLANRSLIKAFLLRPRFFDVVSAMLQLRDYFRLKRSLGVNPEQDEHFRRVFDHNAGVTGRKLVTFTRRAEAFYHILGLPPRDRSNEKILIVGPRNVQELFIAWLYGYKWDNITAIDLYSTNRKIQVMNMEEMTFPDSTFDAVAMAHTFGYAKEPARCLAEVSRVLKAGGRFAFGANYLPGDPHWPANRIPFSVLRKMMAAQGFELFYHGERSKAYGADQLLDIHILGVVKKAPSTMLESSAFL